MSVCGLVHILANAHSHTTSPKHGVVYEHYSFLCANNWVRLASSDPRHHFPISEIAAFKVLTVSAIDGYP